MATDPRKAPRTGIFGASGSGKTNFLMGLIANKRRMIIFDPEDEFEDFCDVTCTTPEQARAAMAANWRGFRIQYVPPPECESRHLSSISKLAFLAQQPFKPKGNKGLMQMTLVVDELQTSFPLHKGVSLAPHFATLCSRGRKYGIELVGAAQRVADGETRVLGNLSDIYCFRPQGKADETVVANTMRLDRASIGAMPNYHYHHYDGDTGRVSALTKAKKR